MDDADRSDGTSGADIHPGLLTTTHVHRQRFKALLTDYHLSPSDAFLPSFLPIGTPSPNSGNPQAEELDKTGPRWILWVTTIFDA